MSKDEEHGEPKKHHGGGGGGGHAHGGGAHEEHEGAPEWLISFADNVTLMMGFFVILLAMNLKPASSGGGGGEGKAGSPTESSNAAVLDMAIGIREAFNNPVNLGSLDPEDLPLVRRLIERSGESEARQQGPRGREHDVKTIRPGQYTIQGGTVSFDTGSAMLTREARQDVAKVSAQVKGLKLVLDISGHASAAESFKQTDRGMRLSYERAFTVAQALTEDGLGWEQVRILAYADNDRLAHAVYEPAGHQANQRVEIIVTDRVPAGSLPPDDAEPESSHP